MDINVKVTIGAEPELIMHLATLVECVKDVLKVSKSQLTEPEPVPEPAKEPEPAQVKEEDEPAISEADIRKFCMEYVKKDPANKAKVVAAFKAVGATKLPEVKPGDYRKVMELLK